jgi:asparagine synthase (glutamine-hydrolysing)
MNPNLPNSGFFISKTNNKDISEIKHKLEAKGAKTRCFPDENLILASWKQFEDQGMWSEGENAVVYDMDLTNLESLYKLSGIQSSDSMDKGQLLWILYQKYGINFVDRLRGTFAFAIWDGLNKNIYVITDPYGIKPVVYSDQNGHFSAASRIKQLLYPQILPKTINLDAIYHYLFFQAICSPLTIYKEIFKLEPGKGLHHKQNKLIQFTHYDITYKPDRSLTEKEWTSQIYDHVKKAVDVFVPLSPHEKTGCFLSGGTDSSSIAGFYTQLAGKPANTFSIGFEEPQYNELDYARIASNQLKTDYHEYYVTPQDVTNLIERLPKIYDEPFGNASVIPAFYCAHHAAGKGIEVMLGGDGGDEIFGGNERYVTNLIFQRYLNLPENMRTKMIEPLLSILPDKGVFHKAKRYIRRANIPNP